MWVIDPDGTTALALGQPQFFRHLARFLARLDVQLPINAFDVGLDRVVGDDQLPGDIPIGQARNQQTQDPQFLLT